MTNLFTDIPSVLPKELVTTLLSAENVRIERIVSHGHSSPEGFWYDQNEAEWVVVLKGAARLRFEDESSSHELRSGDFVLIPAHRRHRLEWTTPDEPTVWLAVFLKTEYIPFLITGRARLLPSRDEVMALSLARGSAGASLSRLEISSRDAAPMNGMNSVLRTGCRKEAHDACPPQSTPPAPSPSPSAPPRGAS